MKNFKIRTKSLGATLAVTALMGSLAVPGVAEASSKGRKNTAIGLGAAAAHQILTGKTTNGVLLGAGAAYAYKRYQDSRQDEKRQNRSAQYRRNSTTRASNAYRSGNAYGGASTRTSRTGAVRTTRNSRYVPSQTSRAQVTPGTFVFTGPVTRTSSFDGRTITVDHNGILRPALVPDTAVVTRDGARISVHDLREGETVRVTAKQVAPNEWRVLRMNVVEPIVAGTRRPVDRLSRTDETYREERVTTRDRFGASDRFDRTDEFDRSDRLDRTDRIERTSRYDRMDRGELTMADYSGIGTIVSVDESEGSFRVRIGQNTRTVYAMEAQMSGVSRVRDLRAGDRVRVQGDIYGRDVFATRVTMLD